MSTHHPTGPSMQKQHHRDQARAGVAYPARTKQARGQHTASSDQLGQQFTLDAAALAAAQATIEASFRQLICGGNTAVGDSHVTTECACDADTVAPAQASHIDSDVRVTSEVYTTRALPALTRALSLDASLVSMASPSVPEPVFDCQTLVYAAHEAPGDSAPTPPMSPTLTPTLSTPSKPTAMDMDFAAPSISFPGSDMDLMQLSALQQYAEVLRQMRHRADPPLTMPCAYSPESPPLSPCDSTGSLGFTFPGYHAVPEATDTGVCHERGGGVACFKGAGVSALIDNTLAFAWY